MWEASCPPTTATRRATGNSGGVRAGDLHSKAGNPDGVLAGVVAGNSHPKAGNLEHKQVAQGMHYLYICCGILTKGILNVAQGVCPGVLKNWIRS